MTGIRSLVVPGLLLLAAYASAQPAEASSFLDRLARTYRVEVAVAPELLPALDSLRGSGVEYGSVDEFLADLLRESRIGYQVVDGDKIMLRRESRITPTDNKYVLQGYILSAADGEPLPFATVICQPDGPAANADESGHFRLPVPEVSGQVQVHYLGYQSATVEAKTLAGGGSDIRLRESRIPLRQVTIIVPYREMRQSYDQQSVDLSGYTFLSAQDLLSWNADRLLLGMTTYTAFSGDQGIRIRGSDPANSLFLFDGVPAYDPSHFYNIFSPYNPVYFSSIEIFKNNFPVEYGGRIDGLVRARREPRPGKTSLLLDTDLLQSGASGQVSFSPATQLSAAARVSHTGILNEALSDNTSTNFTQPGGFRSDNEWTTSQRPEFDFYDINASFSTRLGQAGHLSAAFFGNQDHLVNRATTGFEASIHQQEILQVEQTYTSRDEWANRGVSIGLTLPLRGRTTWATTGYVSHYDRQGSFDVLLTEKRPFETRTVTGKGFQESRLSSLGFRSALKRTLSNGSDITAGLDLAGYDVAFEGRENAIRFISQAQRETESTLFGEYAWRPGSTWQIDIGSRFTWLWQAGIGAWLPALGIHHSLGEHFTLRAAWSRNLQALRALTTEDRFGRETDYLVLGAPDKGYPVLRSDKFMAGLGFTNAHWGADLEFYFKQSTGFIRLRPDRPDPSYQDQTSPEDYYRLYAGDAWTAGADVTLFYKDRKVDVSLLYTLSRMWEQYDDLFQGDSFAPQEDRRHQLKLQGRYRFGRFIASGLVSYKSRAPYLSFVALQGAGGGIGNASRQDVFRYLPAYFSLDLGLDYTFEVFKVPCLFGASVINLTDHTNVDDLLHLGRVSPDMGRQVYLTQETTLLGRTGNVRLRVIF